MTKTKMKTAAEREKRGKIGDVENSESDVLPPPHRSMMDRKCDGIRAISLSQDKGGLDDILLGGRSREQKTNDQRSPQEREKKCKIDFS